MIEPTLSQSAPQAGPSTPHPPPQTPRKTAPPPTTPRTHNESRRHRHLQTNTTVTISAFCSLISDLTASQYSSAAYTQNGFSPPSILSKRPLGSTEQERLDRIESFREEFMCGVFMRERPPELRDDDFSDGAPSQRLSMGSSSYWSSSFGGSEESEQSYQHLRLPIDPIQCGLLAEKHIKQSLRPYLLPHKNLASLATVARKAMTRTISSGRPLYVECGLLQSPNWSKEYADYGWAKPGVRWGNFKPDLIKFVRKERGGVGQVVWEVVEIKYSGNSRNSIYQSYKLQAIYYHLALSKLFSNIPNLVPSHKISIWLSHDPCSPLYTEVSVALRTNLATVEHHLFTLLPEWLCCVTAKEWEEELVDSMKRKQDENVPPHKTFLQKLQDVVPNPRAPLVPLGQTSTTVSGLLRMPVGLTLTKLKTSQGPSSAPNAAPATPGVSWHHLSLLPPLPDEDDEDLAELFDALNV